MEKELGKELAFDKKYVVGCIQDGLFDDAVHYIGSFATPSENLVALNIAFELRKQQFMELLREPSPPESPRAFFIEKVKPLILLNRQSSKEAARGVTKSLDLLHNFSDLLIMSSEERRRADCLRGSVRAQRRMLGDLVMKLLGHKSLGLRFSYEAELKGLGLHVGPKDTSISSTASAAAMRTAASPLVESSASTRRGPASQPAKSVNIARKGSSKKGSPSSRARGTVRERSVSQTGVPLFARTRQVRTPSSVAVAAFHPSAPGVVLVGMFDGAFQLLQVDERQLGSSGCHVYVSGRLKPGQQRDSSPKKVVSGELQHRITKIKWDPTGSCACFSGSTPTVYVVSFARSGERPSDSFRISEIVTVGPSSGYYDTRAVLNDFIFLTSADGKRSHLLCANDLALQHRGFMDPEAGGFRAYRPARETDYPSNYVVSMAAMRVRCADGEERGCCYGVTMVGDIILWDVLGSGTARVVSKSWSLQRSLGTQSVVDRWIIITSYGDASGPPSKRPAISGKKEARAATRARRATVLACVQQMDGGHWDIVQLDVSVESDGSLKPLDTPLNRYRCNLAHVSEAPQWVATDGGLVAVAGIPSTRLWRAAEFQSARTIQTWDETSSNAKIDPLTPKVCSVALSPDGSILCASLNNRLKIFSAQ